MTNSIAIIFTMIWWFKFIQVWPEIH